MTLKRNGARRLFSAVAAVVLLVPGSMSASRLMTENFEYNTGDLYGQGGWIQYSTQSQNPIQVVTSQLAYDGYQTVPVGKSVQFLAVDLQDQDLKKPFAETAVLSGSLYMSALVNVSKVPTGDVYALTFMSPLSGGFLDGKTGGDNSRIFFCKGDTDNTFKVGIGKNSASAAVKSADLQLNTTYLLVAKYEIVDGTNNDVFSLWVNPATDPAAEPAADLSVSNNADHSATLGVQGVYLRQGTTSSKAGPEMLLGALRVADTWADLFDAAQGGGDVTASITAAPVKFPSEYFQGQTATTTLTVKASGITEDITVGGLASGAVTASASVIPAAEACSDGGYVLTLSLDTRSGQSVNDVLTLTSGETVASVPVTATVYPVTDDARLASLALKKEGDSNIYRYTGTMARVTFVDKNAKRFYLEDMTGALVFDYSFVAETCPFKEGDKVKNIYCMVFEQAQGVTTFMPLTPEMGTVTASGSFKEPMEVNLGEIAADPDSYVNRLVKITDVTFENVAEGATFGTSGIEVSMPYMSGKSTGRVRAFAGTDIIGAAVPATATSVVGISTSASAPVITMRSKEDLTADVEEPALNVTGEMLVEANEYQPINVAVPFARFTVEAVNLSSAASVWLGGANRSMFSIDTETIPAGSGTTVITVTYKPTAKGLHRATINFDAMPTELSSTISLSAKAYDPDNLPVLTADASGLTEFTCNAGETAQQQFSYTATGLLDYGTARVLGDSNGAFRINSNMLMKDGTYAITVTFAPTAEGVFNERIELSADKAESVIVNVSGRTTGAQPSEEKQGDELVFDESNPLASYATDFTTATASNKPLSLDGWKNVAMTGTRAWWSYAVDGNQAAKATLYDSRMTVDEDASMMLLSPALDYKNCTNPLVAFRLRGDYLSDNMTDVLEVLYVDATDTMNPYYEPIGGLNIPASSDASGEWVDYVVDLAGLDLADTFHIAFRLSGQRGRNNSAVYYVDDFSYGNDEIPFIRIHTRMLKMKAKKGQTVTTEEVTVTGLKLTAPIALSMAGANPSNFTLSHSELPAEGGKFTLSFTSDNIGLHEAYVLLSSEGAPDSAMPVYALNEVNTGIVAPEVFDGAATAAVYDINGVLLIENVTVEEALDNLRDREKAVYLIRLSDAEGNPLKTVKYVRP